MGFLLVTAALTIGQCYGGYCPQPQFVLPQTVYSIPQVEYSYTLPTQREADQAKTRSWIFARINGKRTRVWGYLESGKVYYYQTEQPEGWPASYVVEDEPKAKVEVEVPVRPQEPFRETPGPSNPIGQAPKEPLPKWATQGVAEDKISGKEKLQASNHPESVKFVESVNNLRQGVTQDPLDIADKLYLTVISNDTKLRDSVIQEIRSADGMAQYKDKLWIKGLKPEDWEVRETFAQATPNGKPAIILQNPAGRVLHRQMDFNGGAPALFEAIRKANPNYTPGKDSDLRNVGSGGLLSFFESPEAIWIVGGIGVVMLLLGGAANHSHHAKAGAH